MSHSFRPTLEHLDARLVPAVTANNMVAEYAGGTLTLRAGATNDHVEIHVARTEALPVITVKHSLMTASGTLYSPSRLTFSGELRLIKFFGNDGRDVFLPTNLAVYSRVLADGGSEQDKIYGGEMNDELVGGAGDYRDELFGKGGHDLLRGEGGPDLLRGGNGNDVLIGGRGVDHLYGEHDSDVLIGGETMVFEDPITQRLIVNPAWVNDGVRDNLDGGNGLDHYLPELERLPNGQLRIVNGRPVLFDFVSEPLNQPTGLFYANYLSLPFNDQTWYNANPV